jgi:1-aminocyclopropane-1-carboxylate deaminase/D-cysteine desulfhydrase-like pyridoxal-dependent ACC family enzyme
MDCNLPPVETHEGITVVRGDLARYGGAIGGKARTCWALSQGAPGLVTAGSRSSPQANIVATIAATLGIPARIHAPQGALTPELIAAQQAGAEIVQHRAGYNSVIVARARADAKERGWREIPFGMECQEAIEQTAAQVAAIPQGVNRVVIPCGSAMSMAGVITGLQRANRKLHVLGIKVGADPTKRLNAYTFFADNYSLVNAGIDYHKPAPQLHLGNVRLDSHYEAKCLPFLQPGDCFWIVGIRSTEAPTK